MLSKYTRADCHFTLKRMTSFVLKIVPGASRNFQGMWMNIYSPWCKLKTILSCSLFLHSSIGYLCLRCKRLRPHRESRHICPRVVLNMSLVCNDV